MTLSELLRQCTAIAPELLIALTLCVVIAVDMFTGLDRSRVRCGLVSLIGVLIALLVVGHRLANGMAMYRSLTFGSMVAHDQISVFFRMVFLLGAAATILFSMRSRETEGYRQGEYYSLLLGAVLGAMLLASADHFVLFVLGFETLSICCYVLASFIKHERPSAEAGLKYMIYGSVASGVMFFGISYLYGMTGTLSIGKGMLELYRALAENQIGRVPFYLALTLVLAGVGFKMAMVPFHFWCPDVYQGSPTPITAFLSVVSKAAGFAALFRIMLPFFAAVKPALALQTNLITLQELPVFFAALSVVTMTFGNLVALRQTDVKRLLAYSSIAHAGYLLMGMTVYERGSMETMMFYLFIYLLMNLGAFWVVIAMVNCVGGSEIARFRGAAIRTPFLFVCLFIFLIALTGLPPTAGFVAKFMLFKVVVGAGIGHMTAAGALTPLAAMYFAVAIIGVLNSVVSLYYYMSIIRVMAFEEPDGDSPLRENALDCSYAAVFAAPVLLLLYFTPVMQLIQLAAH